MQVEVQFHSAQNWDVYALQTEEENPAGAEAIAAEINDSNHLMFANTFMYRVSRNVLPKLYAVTTRDSSDIQFNNVKVFSQTRLAFDNSVFDETSGVAVRAHHFAHFEVQQGMNAAAPLPIPAVFAKNAKLVKLATGFSNASGLTTDDKGNLFFTDAAKHKIYRWNPAANQADVIGEIPGQPMVMGFVAPSKVLIVAYEKAVYSLDINGHEPPQQVTETATPALNTTLLLPVGLHNQLSVLDDMLQHRGYIYRQGSNTAILSTVEDEHRGYFYAPGTTTAIMAGGTWRPILQSSQLASFASGDRHFVVSEDDERTYSAVLENSGTLKTNVFVDRGGTAVVTDVEGNIYIASGQIYVYDRAGKQVGTVEVPERPSSLAFGGPENNTLFIGARSSIYAVQTTYRGQ
jgi:sugar lactone lactonase YvrE